MLSFMRRMLDLAWMKGPIHNPKPPSSTDNTIGGYWNWREAIAAIIDFIRVDIISLKFMRDPDRTPRLDDLEKEYGVTTPSNISEAERRNLLRPVRYRRKTTAQDDELQRQLQNAGFDLQVYNNSPEGPAIDPTIILEQNFQMQAMEGTNYYAGNTLAYAGFLGGDLLVNGREFVQGFGYFGAGAMWAGNTTSVAGYYEQRTRELIVYPIPTDSDAWPFIFFVGGDADINPVTGEIIGIEQGLVPAEQKDRLEDMILKFKPMFSWCGLVVTFT